MGYVVNRNAKSIKSNHRPEIERIKGYIRDSKSNGFDGSGYPFKKAIIELKQEGYNIKYCHTKCHYKVINSGGIK